MSKYRRQRTAAPSRLIVRAAEGEAPAEGEAAAAPAAIETTGNNFKPVKDIQEIMKVLPHR